MLISHIAAIELPRGAWFDMVDVLHNNFNSADLSVRMACIQTTGFVCEELIKVGDVEQIIHPQVRDKLVSILAGSLENDTPEIAILALKAVFNGYNFLKSSFDDVNKRNFIIN